MIYYVLEDGKVVETEDPYVLEQALSTGTNSVGNTQINDEYRVSTMLMGRDLNLYSIMFPDQDAPKHLFETCVLGGPKGVEVSRYSTLEEAQAGHEEVCEQIRQRIAQQQ
ncbi:hypothetical protein [Pseudomonas sp. PLMAX]|uniref:hypothetical protein n=1 Tax=Pseudomonas sp. PLMAX TaxID=2201998 RepID=UPI0038B8B320